jgi:hypothetical protein
MLFICCFFAAGKMIGKKVFDVFRSLSKIKFLVPFCQLRTIAAGGFFRFGLVSFVPRGKDGFPKYELLGLKLLVFLKHCPKVLPAGPPGIEDLLFECRARHAEYLMVILHEADLVCLIDDDYVCWFEELVYLNVIGKIESSEELLETMSRSSLRIARYLAAKIKFRNGGTGNVGVVRFLSFVERWNLSKEVLSLPDEFWETIMCCLWLFFWIIPLDVPNGNFKRFFV